MRVPSDNQPSESHEEILTNRTHSTIGLEIEQQRGGCVYDPGTRNMIFMISESAVLNLSGTYFLQMGYRGNVDESTLWTSQEPF